MKSVRLKVRSYKQKVVISIAIASLIPLIILSSFAYWVYISELSEKMDASMQATARQIQYHTDNLFTSIRDYYTTSSQSYELTWLMSRKDESHLLKLEALKADELLRGSPQFIEYIEGYGFISKSSGWVLSSKGMYPYEDIKNQKELNALLETETDPLLRYTWVNHLKEAPKEFESKYLDLSGYQLLLRFPVLSTSTDSVMLVKLNTQRVYQFMRRYILDYSVVIMDQNGGVFYENDAAMAAYCAEQFEKLSQSSSVEKVALDSNHTLRVARTTSELHGLVYFIGYNQNLVFDGADRILTLTAVLFFTILILLLFSHIRTKQLYRPVSQLVSYMKQTISSEKWGSEFEYIEHSMVQLNEKKEELELLVHSQKKALIDFFLMRMLRGELGAEQIKQNFTYFEIPEYAFYCILSVNLFFDGAKDEPLNRDALRLALIENPPPELKPLLLMPPVSTGNVIVFLLAGQSETALDETISTAYEILTAYTRTHYDCGLSMGVSRAFEDLTRLRTAFNESVEAIKRTVPTEKEQPQNQLLFYNDISSSMGASTGYDLLLEKEIQKFIDQLDYENACHVSDRFIDNLREKGISFHKQGFELNRFLVAVLMVAANAGLSVNTIYENEEESLFIQAAQCYTPDTLKGFLRAKVILPVIKSLEQFRTSASPEIFDRIAQLVKETRGDITLTECADRLGYHPSYVWRVLKNKKGMNFTDFVSEEKLSMAEDMLLNTSLPVSEIAEILGYTNAQNFIRFFVKHKGATPGRFRKDSGTPR